MSIFGGLFHRDDNKKKDDDAKISLRKEELDIDKKRVQKGEVELGKEIVEEKKSVDVPVEREEVVIERKNLNDEASDAPITNEETIHIPVSEDEIDVDKHTVTNGEVTAHKRTIEDTHHVDENLKREEARINTTGDADVVDNNDFNS